MTATESVLDFLPSHSYWKRASATLLVFAVLLWLDVSLSYAPLPSTQQVEQLPALSKNGTEQAVPLSTQQWLTRLGSNSELRAKPYQTINVTVVLLHRTHSVGLAVALRSLIVHDFVREIIVWNDKHQVLDTGSLPSDIISAARASIRFVNVPGDSSSTSRFLACATMACYDTCYFASDQWINPVMASLLRLYIELGGQWNGRAVTVVPVERAWRDHRWHFKTAEHGLFAAASMEFGAFVPQELCHRFLTQLSSLSVPLPPVHTIESDIYFSIWSNTLHKQIPVDLLPITNGGADSDDGDRGAITVDALQRLSDELRSSRHGQRAIFRASRSPPESHYRAICASDRCLFFTSLTPFGDDLDEHVEGSYGGKEPRTSTPGSTYVDVGQIRSLDDYTPSVSFPALEWWKRSGSFHWAVDGAGTGSAGSTCWTSLHAPRTGDHFGLLLQPSRALVRNVTFHVSSASVQSGTEDRWPWETWTMAESGSRWILRDVARKPHFSQFGDLVIQIQVELQPLGPNDDQRVEKIKMVSRRLQVAPISLCAWSIDGVPV